MKEMEPEKMISLAQTFVIAVRQVVNTRSVSMKLNLTQAQAFTSASSFQGHAVGLWVE